MDNPNRPLATENRLPGPLELAPCVLCGANSFAAVYSECPDRLYWNGGVFDVVKCRECGLTMTNPRPTPDAIGAFYPASYVSFANKGGPRRGLVSTLRYMIHLPYRLRYGAVERASEPLNPGMRVLDVGCGAGLYLEAMQARGWQVWGVEPSADQADAVRRRLQLPPERVFAGRAEDATFAPESFDLVTMFHVLEHLHDPVAVLTKIRSWLREGGTLRLCVPNLDSYESRLFRRLWFGLDVPRHLTHFEPGTVRQVLEAAGFEVECITCDFQATSTTGSLVHVWRAVTGSRRRYRHSPALYNLALPVVSILMSLGNRAAIDVTARRHAVA
jgi:SAM-dependent methyltransferase